MLSGIPGSVETIEYYNEIGHSVDVVGDDASEW